jgi:hypothetical protein
LPLGFSRMLMNCTRLSLLARKALPPPMDMTAMQLVEIRLAVFPSPNRFPVHDDGADPRGPQRRDYPRMLAAPVVAPAGE